MRIIKTIPNENFTVSIFDMNEKYVVKLEGGSIEQSYKINKDGFTGVEELEEMLDDEFYDQAIKQHIELHDNLKKSYKRLKKKSST
ncbi:hypothetical protein [Salibacter sp.]|jgi:hypothetical protein|uniref:hypothetical protein n=1 Tax=Salibacter sp. TaxID=2010995 RepID=UPI00286FDC8D|nr:hypothetical protein [Salibacter sp.]MDR9397905.1 hypothetical protein [Salibacter sp.]MDR9486573.1 hypothetical protein [Salibacter sp.]